MTANDFLTNVHVASPCAARWGHMVGDDRVRFCHQCRKHVYNLSAMTAEEAAVLIHAKEGRFCARFYRRADGTMLTADCPMGAAWFWGRVKKFVWAGTAAMAVTLASPVARSATDQPGSVSSPARGKWSEAWNRTLAMTRKWLLPPNLQRPQPNRRLVMGEICIPTPPGKVPPVAQPLQPNTPAGP